jgi:pimeloyl-ACP methyl ester carboxylesterase
MVTHQTVQVDSLNVFYREAGDPGNPKLLLLGGFPASSHQFRNLIPAIWACRDGLPCRRSWVRVPSSA